MRPKTSYKALLLEEGILIFELSWTAVIFTSISIVSLQNKSNIEPKILIFFSLILIKVQFN